MSELPAEEERIELLKAGLVGALSALAQTTKDPLELLNRFEREFEIQIKQHISDIAKADCYMDVRTVIRDAKIDLGKPAEKRSVSVATAPRDNVVSVDFGDSTPAFDE